MMDEAIASAELALPHASWEEKLRQMFDGPMANDGGGVGTRYQDQIIAIITTAITEAETRLLDKLHAECVPCKDCSSNHIHASQIKSIATLHGIESK